MSAGDPLPTFPLWRMVVAHGGAKGMSDNWQRAWDHAERVAGYKHGAWESAAIFSMQTFTAIVIYMIVAGVGGGRADYALFIVTALAGAAGYMDGKQKSRLFSEALQDELWRLKRERGERRAASRPALGAKQGEPSGEIRTCRVDCDRADIHADLRGLSRNAEFD